ncbi:MAG: PEGA domain-containing protein [Acidimicrobiia bacterium]|nr:PEGA domain-containing protein [Acidimicrobiia bacterium]
MRVRRTLVSAGALALVFGIPLWAAAEQRRGSRAAGDGEGGRQVVERGGGDERPRGGEPRGGDRPVTAPSAPERGSDRAVRRGEAQGRRDAGPSSRAERRDDRDWDRDRPRGNAGREGRAYRRGDDRWHGRPGNRDRWDRWDRRPNYRYAPRVVVPRYPSRRFYGPGGNFSVYFGRGSGYRFGSWYSGRVYGYVPPVAAYGAARYYGEVRLRVRPRFADVYVDGYYAGIVDDFDCVFQRLTIEVGPHQVEIVAPGYAPQLFEIYVDPVRTVELHADLYPED